MTEDFQFLKGNFVKIEFLDQNYIFDRESISHGPTSLKIVVVVVGTLLKVTFNVTVTFNITVAFNITVTFNVTVQLLVPQKSQNVPKCLKKSQKCQTIQHFSNNSKSLKRFQTSQKVPKCI